MQLQQTQQEGEPRYDVETLRKVTALAERLQAESHQTVTAREIEEIGSEVGLQRQFIHEALRELEGRSSQQRPVVVPTAAQPTSRHAVAGLLKAWWAAGWIIPVSAPPLFEMLFGRAEVGGVLFLPLMGVYIGVGVFLSHLVHPKGEQGEHRLQPTAPPPSAGAAPLSRHEVLDVFFRLEAALQAQKQHRAFLSVDVAGSSEMKEGAGDLQVEYSFGEFQRWVGQVVRSHGGTVHSAAGDGMMAVFPDEGAAVRAGRDLQQEIGRFNRERNRLSRPFRLRCGVSAGEVALDLSGSVGTLNSPVIDRAAALQKRAQPGQVAVSSEVAPVALGELGGLVAMEGAPQGSAYTWQAAP